MGYISYLFDGIRSRQKLFSQFKLSDFIRSVGSPFEFFKCATTHIITHEIPKDL